MIPTLSKYIQQLHMQRQHWLTRAERRRAFMLVCVLMALVACSVVLWILYR